MESRTAAEQTLSTLEERLQRLQFLLHGDLDTTDANFPVDAHSSVTARLQRLDRSMQSLKDHSSAVSQLLSLQTRYPTLFADTPTDKPTHDMPDHALASLVISHAPSYQSTASRLTSLNDVPIPDASLSATLMSISPRLDKLSSTALKQELDVAELQNRSAAVLERWYEVGVVGMGDCWSEWEERLVGSEIAIRREEARRARENGIS